MAEEIRLPNNVKVSCEKNPNPDFNNHFCRIDFPENNKISFQITEDGFMRNARAEDTTFDSSVPGYKGNNWASVRDKKTNIFAALEDIGFGRTNLEVADYDTDRTLLKKTFRGK